MDGLQDRMQTGGSHTPTASVRFPEETPHSKCWFLDCSYHPCGEGHMSHGVCKGPSVLFGVGRCSGLNGGSLRDMSTQ